MSKLSDFTEDYGVLKNIPEYVNNSASGTVQLDFSTYSKFTLDIVGDTTLDFTGMGSDKGIMGSLLVRNPDSYSVSVIGDYDVEFDRDFKGFGGNYSLETYKGYDSDNLYSPPLLPIIVDSDQCAIKFNNDGTKMYTLGKQNNRIYQHALSTPWDTRTAMHDNAFIDIATKTGYTGYIVEDFCFSPDGSYIFIIGEYNSSPHIRRFDLTVPWNISNVSLYTYGATLTEESYGRGISVKDDGTKFYVTGTNDDIHEYTFNSPWDLINANANHQGLFDASAQSAYVGDHQFSDDGSKLYIRDYSNGTIYKYSLSTPWVVTSGVTFDESSPFNNASGTSGNSGFVIVDNGSKVYTISSSSRSQYNLSTSWDITSRSFDYMVNTNIAGANVDFNVPRYGPACFSNDGTRIFGIDNSDNYDMVFWQIDLSIPYDITTATFSMEYTVVSNFPDMSSASLSISGDGTKIIVANFGNDNALYMVNLSTPWEITSATYNTANKLTYTTANHRFRNVHYYNNGDNMIAPAYDYDSQKVYFLEYSLSTKWDITTATLDEAVDVGNYGVKMQQQLYHDISYDGRILFTTDQQNIYKYVLSTPWDVKTAQYIEFYPYRSNHTAYDSNNDYAYGMTIGDGVLYVKDRDTYAIPLKISATNAIVADHDNKIHVQTRYFV